MLSLAAEKICHPARWLKRLPELNCVNYEKSVFFFGLFGTWIWSLWRVHVGHNECDKFFPLQFAAIITMSIIRALYYHCANMSLQQK